MLKEKKQEEERYLDESPIQDNPKFLTFNRKSSIFNMSVSYIIDYNKKILKIQYFY